MRGVGRWWQTASVLVLAVLPRMAGGQRAEIGGPIERSPDSLMRATDVVHISGDLLRRSGAQSLGEALIGKIAGVRAALGSGSFGALAALQLRGIGSYASTAAPLVLVDGIPVGVTLAREGSSVPDGRLSVVRLVTDFPLVDVDHVTVLRGASASAMYGPTAYNGVILIVTKAPEPGSMSVSLSQRAGAAMRNESLATRRFARADARIPEMWDSCKGFCDHEDEFFGGARAVTATSLSVRGGSRSSSGSVALDHRLTALPLRGSAGTYVAGRAAITQHIGKRVTLRAHQVLARTRAEFPFGEGTSLSRPPGSYVFLTPSWSNTRGVPGVAVDSSMFNPRVLFERIDAPWRLAQSVTGASLNAQLWHGARGELSLHAIGGLHRLAQRDSTNTPGEGYPAVDGIWRSLESDSRDESVMGWLAYAWTRAGARIESQLGYQWQSREYTQSSGARNRAGLTLAESITPPRSTLRGLWANTDLRLAGDRSVVSLGLRRDDAAWPGVAPALSWRAGVGAKLPGGFSERVSVRAALGQVARLSLPGEWSFGFVGAQAIERRREGELGVSYSTAGGWLRIDATAYQSRASNVALGFVPVGPSGGALSFLPGGIRTRGLDASITLRSTNQIVWDWSTTLRAGRSRSTFVAQEGGLPNGTFLSTWWGHPVTFQEGRSLTALPRGDASPSFVFSQSNDIARRRWRLTTQLDGELGGRVANLSQNARDERGLSATPDGGASRAADANDGALVYLQDRSWIRLREVVLSHVLNYRGWWILPPNTRLELTARDVFTWSPLDAYDPAARLPVALSTRAHANSLSRFPMMRTISLGLVLGM